jgi:predicted transcriptional regulator
MISIISIIKPSCTLGELAARVQGDGKIPYFIVKDHGKIMGVIPSMLLEGPLNHYDPEMSVENIAIKDFEIVNKDASFGEIVDKIRANHTSLVLVIDLSFDPSGNYVIGVVTKEELTSSISVTEAFFSDNQ